MDLGTSNSCVAIAPSREIEVLRNTNGEPTTASVVAVSKDESIEIVDHAKDRRSCDGTQRRTPDTMSCAARRRRARQVSCPACRFRSL
jgi:molecular chaperone DnaK (HSP70)